MKKIVAMFFLLLIVFSTTFVIAAKDNLKVKRGDEFLKDSFAKLEEVGNKSVLEMFGEFFEKGSPTLSQDDKNRIIINVLIFSCIANVGIAVFILKQDKKEINTIVNTGDKDLEFGGENKKKIIKDIREVDCHFKESLFIKKVIKSTILVEDAKKSRNIDILKSAVTTEFLEELEKQLQLNVDEGLVEKSSKIKIKRVQLVRFYSGKNLDTIVALVKVSKIQYWTNLDENKILIGNRKTPVKLFYKMSFVRSKGVQFTKDGSCKCVNCGAEVASSEDMRNVNQFKCEYCGLTTFEGWTLNSMKQLK